MSVMRASKPTVDPPAGSDNEDSWPPELVTLYRDRALELIRLAYLITDRRNIAEEVVQDAFLATRAAWSSVDNASAYVRRAVVNRSRSWLRHQIVEERHLRAVAEVEHGQLGADELWDALGRLSERRRTAIVLRFYTGLPDEEIAGVLGCRPATVRTAIHRGLKDLRREIAR
jgi:RNA polymerase sigma factor (sigma-70 family)